MRPLYSVAPWVVLLGLSLPAWGSGMPDAPRTARGRVAEPASAAATASAASAALGAAVAPTGPKALGVPDPMDVVRERLALRLAVLKTADKDPNLVRVGARPPAGASAPAAAGHGHRTTDATRVAGAGAAARPIYAEPVHAAGNDLVLKPAKAAASAFAKRAEPAHAHPPHWDYGGAGSPDRWAQLSPEFAACGNGKRQSPIDIRDGIRVELDPVKFEYQPSAFSVTDNGHTVQVDVAAGNRIEVAGRTFDLQQFHFHRPSEEKIDGKPFDMVAHLVHRSADGKLAVVAVLLEAGSAHALVQSVWNNLPLEKGEAMKARAPLDLNQLLPAERGYYTYMGSLTTPPCSEGVLWMVMRQPVNISPEQIAIFARLYPMNARPVQAAAGRLIKQSN